MRISSIYICVRCTILRDVIEIIMKQLDGSFWFLPRLC